MRLTTGLCSFALAAVATNAKQATPAAAVLAEYGDMPIVLSQVPDDGMFLEPIELPWQNNWLSGSLRGLSARRHHNDGNEGVTSPLLGMPAGYMNVTCCPFLSVPTLRGFGCGRYGEKGSVHRFDHRSAGDLSIT